MPSPILRYLNPWRHRRERRAELVAALRKRDGDRCARCRRPMRFDLVEGSDQGAAIETITPGPDESIDHLRLCHPRCNASGVDHTEEVAARVRRKNETELFAKARKRRRAA